MLFGGQALLLDPKSERGNWKETLPEIAHEINIVNLTSDKDNAGLLDPFVIMKNVKDAESLAIDILTFLTGISSRDGEKFPVLRKAVRSVTQSDSRGLLHVIDELRREDTPISRNIADHIDSFTDYDFAHLLFSDGTVENAVSYTHLNAQSLVLMAIVGIGIYLGFKREFSKLIGFLVVALIAVGLVFNAGGVKDVLLELFNKIIGA